MTTTCTVVEDGSTRHFTHHDRAACRTRSPSAPPALRRVGCPPAGTPVYSPFQGKTELVEINVKVGDTVTEGQVVAAVEAMKAKHDVKAPCAGKVVSIDAEHRRRHRGRPADHDHRRLSMDAFTTLLAASRALPDSTWQNLVMFAVGGVLIYLAIRKGYEPLLLIPIGFGAILANLPHAMMSASADAASRPRDGIHPLLQLVYDAGIRTEFLPPVIFLGVGALTDFRPLLGRPITFLLGAAAQFGIFVAALGAFYLFGFSLKEAAAIGIIGGADGPTSIFLAAILAPAPARRDRRRGLQLHVAGAGHPAADHADADHRRRERAIDMPQAKPVSKTAVILFPIVTAVLASLAIPACAPLIGMLMFGNLLRESAVTDRLFKTAGGALINIVTIFLGHRRRRDHGGHHVPRPADDLHPGARRRRLFASPPSAGSSSPRSSICSCRPTKDQPVHRRGRRVGGADGGAGGAGFRLQGNRRQGQPADGGHGPERRRRDRLRARCWHSEFSLANLLGHIDRTAQNNV